jgi:hypothetical protein
MTGPRPRLKYTFDIVMTDGKVVTKEGRYHSDDQARLQGVAFAQGFTEILNEDDVKFVHYTAASISKIVAKKEKVEDGVKQETETL